MQVQKQQHPGVFAQPTQRRLAERHFHWKMDFPRFRRAKPGWVLMAHDLRRALGLFFSVARVWTKTRFETIIIIAFPLKPRGASPPPSPSPVQHNAQEAPDGALAVSAVPARAAARIDPRHPRWPRRGRARSNGVALPVEIGRGARRTFTAHLHGAPLRRRVFVARVLLLGGRAAAPRARRRRLRSS